jgi:urea transport system substrate-binding protein
VRPTAAEQFSRRDTSIMQPFAPPRDSRPDAGGSHGPSPRRQQAARPWWRRGLPALAAIGAAAGLAWLACDRLLIDRRPIVVGMLHPQSGSDAVSGRALIDAAVLAIEEINRSGGLLGRPVRWVIAEGGPDDDSLARQAERLIRDEHADVILGCGPTADRRSVVTVVEREDHLLVQPLASAGLAQSAAVVSTGAVPNQQIAPAVQWCHDALSARRFLIVGPDDVGPRCIAAIAADQIKGVGDEVVGECLAGPGGTAIDDAVRRVVESAPDVVLCLFTGDDAASFLGRLRAAGIRAERSPAVAFGLSEDDLSTRNIDDLAGHYSASSYFQSIDRPENLAFVRAFKARYGEDRGIPAAAAGGHDAVRLWAQAVLEAETTDIRQVREALRRQSLDAPGGIIAVDPETQHTWQPASIGRVRGDRQFEIVWTSRTAVRPVPYPLSRSRSAWEALVDTLQQEADRRVARPARDRAPPEVDRAASAGGLRP